MYPSPPSVVHVIAPAKLNVFLELLGRREDGFHQIDTVMVAINRFDRIEVEVSTDPAVDLRCVWDPHATGMSRRYGSTSPRATEPEVMALPPAESNLAYKAVNLFRQQFAVEHGFRISIHKSIPSGAGLGGASSDAAATLRAVASLCQVDAYDSKLLDIAASIGSDVPMFLGRRENSCAAVRATGRGEIVSPLEHCRDWHFVVIHPPEGLSTAAVYRNTKLPSVPEDSSAVLGALQGTAGSGLSRHLRNRLYEAATPLSRWVDRVLDAMRRQPILGCQMTGSGSACFAVCSTAAVARRIARRLSAWGLGPTFHAYPVSLPGQQWLYT